MSNEQQTPDDFLWNITQIARAFDLNRDTVRKRLVQAGVNAVKTQKGVPLYNLAEAGKAVFNTQESSQVGYTPDELPPKERKEYFQSENERLKYEKEIRLLVPVHDMAMEFSRVLKILIQALDSLPDILEERCGLSFEGQEEVIQITNELREKLYQKLIEPDFEESDEDMSCQQPVPETSS